LSQTRWQELQHALSSVDGEESTSDQWSLQHTPTRLHKTFESLSFHNYKLLGGVDHNSNVTIDDDKFLLRLKMVNSFLGISKNFHPGYSPGPTFHAIISVLTALIYGVAVQRVNESCIDTVRHNFYAMSGAYEMSDVELRGAVFHLDRGYLVSCVNVDMIMDSGGEICGTMRKNAESKHTHFSEEKVKKKVCKSNYFIHSFINVLTFFNTHKVMLILLYQVLTQFLTILLLLRQQEQITMKFSYKMSNWPDVAIVNIAKKKAC